MFKLLEEAIATIQRLPERDQQIVAEFLLSFANAEAYRHQLTDDQVGEVKLAKREVREGKVASGPEMDDMWRRFSR